MIQVWLSARGRAPPLFLAIDGLMSDESNGRMSPLHAARAFVELEFPEAEVAIAAGSFIRGEASAILLLLINNRWIGRDKWVVRALRRFDERHAMRLDKALSEYYGTGDKTALVAFARDVLEKAGGPVFEGFYRSGRRSETE